MNITDFLLFICNSLFCNYFLLHSSRHAILKGIRCVFIAGKLLLLNEMGFGVKRRSVLHARATVCGRSYENLEFFVIHRLVVFSFLLKVEKKFSFLSKHTWQEEIES